MADQHERIVVSIGKKETGKRLDQALASLLPDYSRSRLQEWIKAEQVSVDGKPRRPRDKVVEGEVVELTVTLPPKVESGPEAIPLDIVFQDEELVVINKPAGMVVHPAAGNPDGTLMNALLHFDSDLIKLPRAGIVHRLDKETSGLLVVARTLKAHHWLVGQLQERRIKREYRAVVQGVMISGGTVDAPIGRHPTHRIKMAVNDSGKSAITHYRVQERFSSHTYIQVTLETGRTHQIRVHMAHIRYPLVGDPLYGGRPRPPAGEVSAALLETLREFPRQALHANRLGLSHPSGGEQMEWESPLPDDMQALLRQLRSSVDGS